MSLFYFIFKFSHLCNICIQNFKTNLRKSTKQAMNSLTKTLKRFKLRFNYCEYATSALQKSEIKRKPVREWSIQRYGSLEELMYRDDSKRPRIKDPNEVLVRVLAASVNPIDVAMIKGYGSTLFNLARKVTADNEFPLVLGRDFVGEVVQKGMDVKDKEAELGQTVWGVIPVHKQGCHRDYVTLNKYFISSKPTSIPDLDASGVLYAGLTAWSGLYLSGNLGGPLGATTSCGGGRNKKVLVLGASGGVGTMATQILQAEGAHVTATCSTDAVPMIERFGVANVIDYKAEDSNEQIAASGPFDLVLDCAGKGSEYAKELPCSFHTYVTFSSPTLRNMDQMGILAGNVKNFTDFVQANVSSVGSSKGTVRWGYFVPAPNGIEYLKRMVQDCRITPVISEVFPFEKADLAYKRVDERHLRGKVVIDFSDRDEITKENDKNV